MKAAGIVSEQVSEQQLVDFNGWLRCDDRRGIRVVGTQWLCVASPNVLPWLGHVPAVSFLRVGAVSCNEARCEARP